MANRFLNNIRINDEYTLPATDGTENQIIVTDGAGNLSFNDLGTVTGAITGVESNLTYYEVKNSSGAQILKGKGVMAVGTDGNSGHILIDEMVADGSVEARYFLGVLSENLDNGSIGRVIAFGELDQFNTLGQNGETWTNGQVLWCDPDSAGDFTITEPDGPNLKIPAAFIMKAATNGKIQIRVQGHEGIKDLYDTKITTQADGELLVWNNTLGVWQNDGTATIDYTNGRVGIGTINPSSTLNINGGTGSLSTGLTFGDGDTGIWESADDALRFSTSSSTRMLIDPAGNVGIGTTSPSAKLDVVGTGKFTGQVTIPATPVAPTDAASKSYVDAQVGTADTLSEVLALGNTSGANDISMLLGQKIYFNNDGENIRSIVNGDLELNSRTELRIKANSNGSAGVGLEFWNGGSEKMRIDSSGNVGIGTTNPATNLEVISDTGAVLRLGTSDTVVLDGDTIGRIEFFSSDSTNTNSGVGAFIDLVADGDQNNFAPLGDLRFATSYASAQNATTRMTIKGNGNVGIGTTSPSRKLTIGGIANTGDGLKIEDPSNTAFGAHLTYYDISSEVWLGGITNNVYNDTLSIHRDATRTITITSSGNVGIGTTNPVSKVHVFSPGYPQISLGSNAGNWQLGVSTGNEFAIRKGTSGSNFPLWIDSNSNIGIGTTSPTTRLEVLSNANEEGISIVDSSDNLKYKVRQFGGNSYSSFWNASNIEQVRIASGGSSYFNGGNVGIGTTNPNEKLHAAGNIHAYDASGIDAALFASTAAGSTTIAIRSLGITHFNGGNVGIATIGPSQKLDVNGKIRARSWFTGADDTNTLYSSTSTGVYIQGSSYTGTGSVISFRRTDGSINAVVNTETGNVGIGTTNPDQKLTINNGSISMTDSYSIRWGDNYLTGLDSVDALRLFTAGTERMRIDSSGNVGIGTTSPAKKLDVAGEWILDGITGGHFENYAFGSQLDISELTSGGWARANRIVTSDSDGYVFFGVLGNGTTLTRSYWTVGDPSVISASGYDSSNGIILLKNGDVGIGTTSPSTKLHVSGVITATGGNSTEWNTAYSWGDHSGLYAAASHTHDDRYYTETETNNFFSGATAITGYNKTNWDAAYTYSQVGHLPLSGGTLSGDLTVNGGDIILGGTGRIQGVDTVSAGTDAANKTYVDNAISGITDNNWYVTNATFGTATGDLVISGNNAAVGDTVNLDGRYLLTSGTAANSQLLDSLDSTQFLRSDAADTASGLITFTSGATFGSGVTLTESTDRPDLLYINSSTSGWGGLQIGNTSNEFIFSLMGDGNIGGIFDDLNGDWIIQWDENSEVRLYHNGGERLATTSAGATVTGDLTVTGNGNFTGTEIQGDGRTMLRYSDLWLRINEDNDFTSGIYCGTGILRTDGEFQVGSAGTKFLVTSAGAVTAESTLTLDNGQIVLNGTGRIQGIDTVSAGTDAANKTYVDNAVFGLVDGSGTAGHVAFWSDSDTITGESNLFWDATNNRLGVGTAAPGSDVEVDGLTQTNKFRYNYPAADKVYSGEIAKFGTVESSSAGDIVFLNSSGKWVPAKADTIANGAINMLGFYDGTDVILRGPIRFGTSGGTTPRIPAPTPTPTPGQPLYLSPDVAGEIFAYSQLSSFASGEFIRIIGHIIDYTNDVFYFNPDNTWVEKA